MKSRLLAGLIAIMTLSGISASAVNNENENNVSGPNDTRIIVELDGGVEGLTSDEIFKSQDKMLKKISREVGGYNLLTRYSVLNNAVAIEVNSQNVDAIRELEGVASITYDKIHAKKELGEGESYYTATNLRPTPVAGEDTGAMVENISAKTMGKPSNTNDGEGTVIAILDLEFYFRGSHAPSLENNDDGTAWNHAVFKPLDASVAQRFTYDNLTTLTTSKDSALHAKRQNGKLAGEEGSLYFNNKVPFYFDYGGESTSYGKIGPTDFDVSSNLGYHGSHVATIAGGNADTYKGIAPKAQLACMKVFTVYEADETGEQMGFGTSTGAYDSAILSAVEDAITLGVDGINMSLGSDLDDFDGDSITMQTLSKLANNAGILSAISAGNAGKASYSFTGGYGNWTTDMVETGILGSYANSTDNMIIASGQPTQIYYEHAFALKDSNGDPIKNVSYEDQIVNREGIEADYEENDQRWMTDIVKTGDIGPDGKPVYDYTKEVEWLYIPGFGTAEDYPTDATAARGKVVVVNRGSSSFADKYSVAVAKGAIGLVIINNDPTANDFNFRCSFGDEFQSKIPCALALYKDKPTFESNGSGKFVFISKEVSTNDLARTISTYSTDGARFDYALKPDVTTPGENIRGAVPPQNSENRYETPYSTYQYLSGTSMAAPNYAGCQSLVLSKRAKGVYSEPTPTKEAVNALKEYRKTVDLRLMSTAKPMFDSTKNPEDGEAKDYYTYTSPRMQGAGLVDLNGAYNTEVYLDGLNANGQRINKSKIQLFNNEDIAKGKLNLSFMAINEGAQQTYTAKVTVMRPAIANSNKVLSGIYKNIGEVSDLENIPGLTYVKNHGFKTEIATNSDVGYKKNDVIKLSKQIVYYNELQTLPAGTEDRVENYDQSKALTLEPGYYYNSAEEGCNWEVLPGYDYQSIQDVVIDTFTREVTIPAGTVENPTQTRIDLDSYSLTDAVKDDILAKFPYGCAIEGFVELQQSNETKLSMPYLGFYSGLDKDENNTLRNAPVVEPFDFEKNPADIYPSDLVNDVAGALAGKYSCEFGSSWTVGYAETTMDVNTDSVLTNDSTFESMAGFHQVGVSPVDGSYFENPKDNIYIGNPKTSNTMIIHQFVMRSVKDNYFEIRNSSNEVVYKSVLTDMLFGDKQLYKSHLEANYLSAGYVAHRASAIIPLYDYYTREAFADGEYTLTFNYQLCYDNSWVSKSYNFFIDSTAPEITSIKEYKGTSGEARVRIEAKDMKICDAIVGFNRVEFEYDEANDVYFIDNTKQYFIDSMAELNQSSDGKQRLFISFTDAAWGETTSIIHFFGDTFSNYVLAQGSNMNANMDFIKDGENVSFIEIDWDGFVTDVHPTDYIKIKTNFGQEFNEKEVVDIEIVKDTETVYETVTDNTGIIIGASVGGALLIAGVVLIVIIIRKKKAI